MSKTKEEVQSLVMESVQEVERSRARLPLEDAIEPAAKNRMLHPRPGMERRALEMIVAARNFPSHVPAALPDDLDQELAEIEALRAYEAALENATKVVKDTMYRKMSRAWKGTLDLYNVLQRQSGAEPEILPGLAAMKEFLATGPRTPAPESEEKPVH